MSPYNFTLAMVRFFFPICAALCLITALDFCANPDPVAGEADGESLPALVDFNFHVKPVLADKCFACHGPDANKREAGLRLDVASDALAELPEHPGAFAIVPGKPEQSELIRRIRHDDPLGVMPPPDSKLSLNEYEKAVLEKWIRQGAVYKPHWAFIPPAKAKPPKVRNARWPRSSIDNFVLQRLEQKGWSPAPEADRVTLLRRVSLDLTGLPPTPAQVDAFIKDTSPDAYEKRVDSLLASRAYGERMALEWLDAARYADSHGYQDDSYRTMWPWRDWVIHAFNSNLPYNQFLTWQLAGDLMPNASKAQILATGFNRNHPITQEGGVIDEEYRSSYVADRANTLGKSILGITLECAKCHDHKYDPFTQEDYYGLYAFFNNVAEKGLQMDAVQAAAARNYADAPAMPISDADVASILQFINKRDTGVVRVMVMNDSMPRPTFVLKRGNYDSPDRPVKPVAPSVIAPYSRKWPGNRLGLAQWLTSSDHPLTARVYVNRLWAMLFGQGLVRTVEDFGNQGALPTHPELLDWLAVDFMDKGWDIKKMMRQIVLSATYRQSSRISEKARAQDPENRFLSHGPRHRMPAEILRDYVLATSGLLNREIGGPSVKPYQPPGLWEETNAGENRGILTTYVQDTGADLYRRSLYTFWKRTLPHPVMTLFDAPTRDNCEVRRQKTNTPLQALAMQNDVQVMEASRVLAQEIVSAYPEDPAALKQLFLRILLRPSSNKEIKELTVYFNTARQRFKTEPKKALRLLATGNYPLPRQQIDPARHAALMLCAQLLYNLDEALVKS